MARRPLFKRHEFKLEGTWEGWDFTAIVNLPLRVLEDYGTKEASTAAMRELLGEALVDWNFTSDDGKASPPPSADALRDLPHDLVVEMARVYIEKLTVLPQA